MAGEPHGGDGRKKTRFCWQLNPDRSTEHPTNLSTGVQQHNITVYSAFVVPNGTLRLPWLRFIRAISSVVRQMSGYNSQRRDTARIVPNYLLVLSYALFWFVLFYALFWFVLFYALFWFVLFYYCFCRLCCSIYCLFINMYCTTATGSIPNCS